MTLLAYIIWFVIFLKLLLFWLWLWQLKEYHWGRLKAHFERQAARKIASSLWRLKYPKFTLKILVIFITSIVLEVFLFLNFSLLGVVILSLFLVPLVFAFFQLIAVIWRNFIISQAKKKRVKFKDLLAIGITGSYGKTSTKEFLATILSRKFRVLKTREHQNSEIGIANCILKDLKREHEIFIAEIGAYNKGKVKEVSLMLKPKIGVVTGINEQHLALFGTMENLISAEGGVELAKSLPKDGILVLNGNNETIISNLKSQISNLNLKAQIFCSTKKKMDFWAEDIKVEKEFISFKVCSKNGDRANFRVNLVGGYNVENILLAVALAQQLGMSLTEISKVCQNIKQEQGSMVVKKGKNGINILDSSYSANPDGVLADLEHLKIWQGRKVIVMPCLIELGKVSGKIHRKIGKKIGEICDLAIITTKDKFRELKEGAIESKMPEEKILFIEKPEKIILFLNNYLKPNDTILFEGRVNKKILDFHDGRNLDRS